MASKYMGFRINLIDLCSKLVVRHRFGQEVELVDHVSVTDPSVVARQHIAWREKYEVVADVRQVVFPGSP